MLILLSIVTTTQFIKATWNPSGKKLTPSQSRVSRGSDAKEPCKPFSGWSVTRDPIERNPNLVYLDANLFQNTLCRLAPNLSLLACVEAMCLVAHTHTHPTSTHARYLMDTCPTYILSKICSMFLNRIFLFAYCLDLVCILWIWF